MIALKVEKIGDKVAIILNEEAIDVLNAQVGGMLHLEPTSNGHVLAGYFSPPVNLMVRLAERTLARVTDRIITLSPAQQREIVGRFGIAPTGWTTPAGFCGPIPQQRAPTCFHDGIFCVSPPQSPRRP